MVDPKTLVLLGCFAAAACVLFWLDRRNEEEIEPERRSDMMPTTHTDITGLSTELEEVRTLYRNVHNQ